MSNTKNTTANKKNRMENGRRPDSLGSKPHSKGVSLLRPVVLRSLSRLISERRNALKAMVRERYNPNDNIVNLCVVELVNFFNRFRVAS